MTIICLYQRNRALHGVNEMVNVIFSELVKFIVNNQFTVEKAVDMVTCVYWDDLELLDMILNEYSIFKYTCKYESFAEMMLKEWNRRNLKK